MGLVIRRLYFGKATRKEIGMNGRILRDLNRRGNDWETLARVVEGLALRRDRGELGIRRDDPDYDRIRDRIRAALGGKDLRVKNRYPKVKRPRVELDLRKKAS
jgi:hypothetical protein